MARKPPTVAQMTPGQLKLHFGGNYPFNSLGHQDG